MTKDEIIKLARQAEGTPYVNRHYPGVTSFGFNETTLLAFANLVAAAEREACAELCDGLDDGLVDGLAGWQHAEAIRARGTI